MKNEIKDRIKSLRGNLTQDEFAKYLGFHKSYISNYESGKIKPTTEFYLSLATKLNVNLNWLITGNEYKFISSEDISKVIEENNYLKEVLNDLERDLNKVLINTKTISKKNYTITLSKYGLSFINLN